MTQVVLDDVVAQLAMKMVIPRFNIESAKISIHWQQSFLHLRLKFPYTVVAELSAHAAKFMH